MLLASCATSAVKGKPSRRVYPSGQKLGFAFTFICKFCTLVLAAATSAGRGEAFKREGYGSEVVKRRPNYRLRTIAQQFKLVSLFKRTLTARTIIATSQPLAQVRLTNLWLLTIPAVTRRMTPLVPNRRAINPHPTTPRFPSPPRGSPSKAYTQHEI